MNQVSGAEALSDTPISEQDVIEFLQQNPAWLDQQPDLLAEMQLHHDSGSATSLLERQLQTLRLKNRQLEQNLRELVQVARRNEDLSQRMHSLALELMGSEDALDMMALVQQQLQTQFNTDQVSFRFLPEQSPFAEHLQMDRESPAFAEMQRIIKEQHPLCGRFPADWMTLLFSDTTGLQSSALVPLVHAEQELGLLVLASEQTDRFDARMGTLFLQQLGSMCSRRLMQFLAD